MLHDSPLGQTTVYVETYTPELLFPIARAGVRHKIGITHALPFDGVDIWNGYEISWLNLKGKPEIALGEFYIPCTSSHLVESKSLKLYLNSLNQTHFESLEAVQKTIQEDLSQATQSSVVVHLCPLSQLKGKTLEDFSGICLDLLDIEMNHYSYDPTLLKTNPPHVEETVYSHLLKSNCLATGQPDWGSVYIHYAGQQINHEQLLKYIISFRRHAGFAEHCVEQIFQDLSSQCHPAQLTVYARYTRRGGLDINPFRSNFEKHPSNLRQFRQ